MIPFELAPDEVEWLVRRLHGIAMTLASERVTRQRLHHRGGDLGWGDGGARDVGAGPASADHARDADHIGVRLDGLVQATCGAELSFHLCW